MGESRPCILKNVWRRLARDVVNCDLSHTEKIAVLKQWGRCLATGRSFHGRHDTGGWCATTTGGKRSRLSEVKKAQQQLDEIHWLAGHVGTLEEGCVTASQLLNRIFVPSYFVRVQKIGPPMLFYDLSSRPAAAARTSETKSSLHLVTIACKVRLTSALGAPTR